jgi:myo-inositol 2-dehydrogenase / D-chiro-inositol 1-dehydrogenase
MSDNVKEIDSSRREFLKTGAAGAAGAAVIVSYGRGRPASAASHEEIRVGVVGCGGRGTGAVGNALQAAPNVKLVAMGDLFKDRLDDALKNLKNREEFADKLAVTPDRMFAGFDAYQKVISTDCNYVILASPPGFRAQHLQAAVAAGKHIFTEKPMAVDGPGIRACFEVAEEAQKKKLGVGVGLQRRHQKGYLETLKRIKQGMLGEVVAGRAYWNQGSLWIKPRQPNWTDVEWQLRNWLYFTWLSGDHIVEQHIHNIDVVQWAIGKPPVAAIGVGGRQQRTDPAYGHIFDHFGVDLEYPNDVHVLSLCRQIPNCHNDVSEHVQGTKGRASMSHKTWSLTVGKRVWTHDGSKDNDPYVQEHIDLIGSIRKGKPLNELKSATESNLAAIMARMAAYTGKRITWEQALNSKQVLVPAEIKFGKMEVAKVAIPGTVDVI